MTDASLPLGAPWVGERFPWLGGDLQTLHNWLTRRAPDLERYPGRRLVIDLEDGTGDRVTGALNEPLPASRLPLVILVHGLTGWEESVYIRRSAGHLLSLGFPVLRLNLRGAGPSRPFCRWHYHAGRSEDLRLVLKALDPALAANGVAMVGFSLGANMLLKFLGEAAPARPILAAVSVSAPIDLRACSVELMRRRNRIYQNWLLREMKAESLAPKSELTRAERLILGRARSVFQFDDEFVAPRNGFAGAEEYYERSSARHYLARIAVPTLVVHALNDPWIPGEAYARVDWSRNPALRPAIVPGGGHVGFHGRGHPVSWHDRRIGEFLAARQEHELSTFCSAG